MQIDYFTIVAQIINFLVLVFLLKHFLYGPVIKSMEEREQKIASRLKEAEWKKREAEMEADSYRKMVQDLSDKRQEMLAGAAEETQALQAELIQRARDEVEANKASWYEALESEKMATLADLGELASEQICTIARRALRDLASEDLDSRIIFTFLQRLQRMDESEREKIREFFEISGKGITVRSAFEISADVRQRIQEIVSEQAGMDVKVQFKIAPELISGVEMSVQGVKIGWSIASYLDVLETNLSKVLEQKIGTEKPSSESVVGRESPW